MTKYNIIRLDLHLFKNPEFAKDYQRFFKTAPGGYGEGDLFLGIRVPEIRSLVKKYGDVSYPVIDKFVRSRWHEERMLGLLFLVFKYEKAMKARDRKITSEVYKKYIGYWSYINSWDLVDVTCHKIIGVELLDRSRSLLYKWVRSRFLWKRRIAIVSTYRFIKHGEFTDTFELSEYLLSDKHDLIHKACGWMLREVGKLDRRALDSFLKNNCAIMPRTMLRYAIEKHSPEERRKFMQ